ncbi:hypothetical protein [Weizmannia agrestimuris]|uniref:hypothetical protein n=1 Tax=Weizmannia agrestimuris TaxID=2941342 RepID=UPI0020406E0E|nr:hypothetical protein [Weizmannia agrestimuris]
MKNDDKRISEGLNGWFEMMNAKGDKGEIAQIVEKYKARAADSNDAARTRQEVEFQQKSTILIKNLFFFHDLLGKNPYYYTCSKDKLQNPIPTRQPPLFVV